MQTLNILFAVLLVGLLAVLRRSQRVHFSLLVELNILVYLVMLYGEVISFEWWGLNSEAKQLNVLTVLHVLNIHMELILVPMNSSHRADCFDTWLIFLWPMVLLWMVGLNGQMFWLFCMFWTFIWSWSWYQWTHLIVLIILIPGSFFYDQWFLQSNSASRQTWPCLGWSLLAAGEAWSSWLVMIFALGGGTPSFGWTLIKSNFSDIAHESNVLPDLSAT